MPERAPTPRGYPWALLSGGRPLTLICSDSAVRRHRVRAVRLADLMTVGRPTLRRASASLEAGRHRRPIHLGEVSGDLTGGQASGVQPDGHRVDVREGARFLTTTYLAGRAWRAAGRDPVQRHRGGTGRGRDRGE